MKYKQTVFEIRQSMAILTLNRPDIRNAITDNEMISEIESACDIVNKDMNIKVMIITGKDPAFSSGGNIKEMANKAGMFEGSAIKLMENYRRMVQRIPLALYHVEIPTIAAVNGPAIGAGCDLSLMCDMRIASKKAKFGETFLNIGLIPGDGGAFFLPRLVGMAKASELTFTGDIIDADSAFQIGMVNQVVEHDKLLDATFELAQKIASKPAFALRMSKKLLHLSQKADLHQLLDQSAALQALCHGTEEHKKALATVLEANKSKT